MTERTLIAATPALDMVVEKLPPILRIQSIARFPYAGAQVLNRAVLFHERASLTVEWVSRHVDVRLTAGALVSVRWLGRPRSFNGAVRIARLVLLERPDPALNPFQTVPRSWMTDRVLVRRAGALWELLPRSMQHLFNAIFWRGDRFQRYLTGPSSPVGHHSERCGNLRHSVEVGERALDLATRETRVHIGVLIMAALLHDAGKADEYRLGYRKLELSDRGRLVGHRLTVLEWITVARALHRVILPEAHYLALIHVLTCAKGAPAWLGLREPQSMEAALLSAADRISGQSDLLTRNAPRHEGFGRFHPHLGVRPFVLAPAS